MTMPQAGIRGATARRNGQSYSILTRLPTQLAAQIEQMQRRELPNRLGSQLTRVPADSKGMRGETPQARC